MNHLYRREPAMFEVDFDPAGFEWIDCHNCDESVLGYVRRAKDPNDFLVVACNFTPTPRANIDWECPSCAGTRRFQQRLDVLRRQQLGERAGPDGRGNFQPRPAGVDPNRLPPLAVTVLKPRR